MKKFIFDKNRFSPLTVIEEKNENCISNSSKSSIYNSKILKKNFKINQKMKIFCVKKKLNKKKFYLIKNFEIKLQNLKNIKHQISFEFHKINEKTRAKLINWLIEVIKIYNQKEVTLYKTIFIMDLYLKKKKEKINLNTYHLIATTSLFISSKNFEKKPISLKELLNNILYNKFKKKEIIQKELDILYTLGFKLNWPTIYDLAYDFLPFITFINKKNKDYFESNSFLLMKMSLFYKNIINKLPINEICASSMILALKILEKLNSENDFNYLISKIIRLFDLNKKKLLKNLRFIKNLLMDFHENFPFVKNLQKYYSFNQDK